jgi:tetratricopeptide (TPR) repeat protein
VLCMFGRFEEALVALGAAQATSPLDVDIGAEKAAVYFRWHRFAQAAEAAKQTLAIESDNELARWVLGLVLEHQGAVDEAEKIYRSLPFRPVRHPIALAHLLAATGRVKEAEEIIEKMRKVAPHPSAEALIYAVMGDRERALQLLEQAYKDRDMNVLFVSMDPRYDLLRREPRFQKICKQLGLPARG